MEFWIFITFMAGFLVGGLVGIAVSEFTLRHREDATDHLVAEANAKIDVANEKLMKANEKYDEIFRRMNE